MVSVPEPHDENAVLLATVRPLQGQACLLLGGRVENDAVDGQLPIAVVGTGGGGQQDESIARARVPAELLHVDGVLHHECGAD